MPRGPDNPFRQTLQARHERRTVVRPSNLLLNKDEAPELIAPPIFREERLVKARALEGVKADNRGRLFSSSVHPARLLSFHTAP
jgi:hypothetical protein